MVYWTFGFVSPVNSGYTGRIAGRSFLVLAVFFVDFWSVSRRREVVKAEY